MSFIGRKVLEIAAKLAPGPPPDPLSLPVPAAWQGLQDRHAALSHAIPHSVVPQLLRPMLVSSLPAPAVKIHTMKDAASCIVSVHFDQQSKDKDAAFLQPLRKLKCVNFNHCEKITEKSLSFLRRCEELSMLNARHTTLSAAALVEHLGHLQHLTSLELGGPMPGGRTIVDVVFIEELVSLRHVKTLRLSGCQQLDTWCVRALSAPTSNMLETLTALNLSACPLVDGTTLVALKTLRRLKSLNCADICLRENDSLNPTLRQTRGDGQPVDNTAAVVTTWADSILAPLTFLPELEELCLDGTGSLCEESFEAIERMRGLTKLDISKCFSVTPAALSHLSNLPKLSTLVFMGNYNDESGFKELAKIRTLTTLDLSWSQNINPAAFEALSTLPNLTTFLLCGPNRIGPDGAAAIGRMKNLTLLNLHGCQQVDDECLRSLAGLRRLRLLNIMFCQSGAITAQGLRHLAFVPNLMSDFKR